MHSLTPLPPPPPALGRRVAYWLVAALVLTGGCILFLDRPLSTWSHADLHRPEIAVLITRAAKWTIICGIALAVQVAALIARLAGVPMTRAWRIAVAASLAALIAAVLVPFAKFAAGRMWPETWDHGNLSWIGNHRFGFVPFGGHHNESFPSGHTARVTAPFAVLWQRLPRLRLLWVLPSIIVAAALVATDFHFLGDCVGGAFLGIGCAALAMTLI